MVSTREKYFELLAKEFSTNQEIMTELINLQAILHLPKGTELYVSDIHGEFPAFQHILRSGAGNIREKINDCFAESLTNAEKDSLALLIAYPEHVLADDTIFPLQDQPWTKQMINQLIQLLHFSASKYTRSKVRKALPPQYSYVIEELMYTDTSYPEKASYTEEIFHQLFQLHESHAFITALAYSIQRLAIDHLHIVGDIFDRGAAADQVMDTLKHYHSVDIQWGNHDILWMGAFFGSKACLLNLLRIAARYNYLYEIEEAYGLNLRPLFLFAEKHYQENPHFAPKEKQSGRHFQKENLTTLEKVHQALTILQLKLEGQIIQRRPEFFMDERLLLDKIDFTEKTVTLNQQPYPLDNDCFQMVNPDNPYKLTEEEQYVVKTLLHSFQQSPRLKKHVHFLLEKGSMYLVYNQHLLLHGCIPLTESGEFQKVYFEGKAYAGKELLDFFDHHIRLSSLDLHTTEDFSTDLIWYGWCGSMSPLFGRNHMTTFERYFILDKTTHKETENCYYSYRNSEKICEAILLAFDLDPNFSRIINGHTPVKVTRGESPIRGNGKLFVIDGGLSKAYQKTTGIAGYSLLNNSFGFQLVTHQPFYSINELLRKQMDTTSLKRVIDQPIQRRLIKETTIGNQLLEQVNDLEQLLAHRQYQSLLKNTPS